MCKEQERDRYIGNVANIVHSSTPSELAKPFSFSSSVLFFSLRPFPPPSVPDNKIGLGVELDKISYSPGRSLGMPLYQTSHELHASRSWPSCPFLPCMRQTPIRSGRPRPAFDLEFSTGLSFPAGHRLARRNGRIGSNRYVPVVRWEN